jgi:hypothetical protein
MKCIVKINGHEAIPVRAIPFVEGWRQLSPDVVAGGLARDKRKSSLSELLCDLVAHHLSENGIGDMLPKEWDCIVDALEALEAELVAKEPDRTKSRPEWLRRSIECLPSHCFVWREEFEASFQSQFHVRKSIHGGVILPITFANPDNTPERTGEHKLNFDPRIPPEMEGVVFEGMPRHSNDAPSPTSRAHVSDKLAKMNQAAQRFWSNADRDDRGTHPDNATVAAWLVQQGFSETLASKAATIIRPEWVPSGRKPEE